MVAVWIWSEGVEVAVTGRTDNNREAHEERKNVRKDINTSDMGAGTGHMIALEETQVEIGDHEF